MNTITQWHRRLDAWQRRGGTPRWFVYMAIVVYARILPTVVIWGAVILAIAELAHDPVVIMAWVGAAALFFWIDDNVEGSYSRIGGSSEE